MPLPALRLVPALLGLLCAIPAAPAGAGHAGQPQSTRLDVGSFTISVGGQRTGREQFSVQRVVTNDGGTIELRSESAVGDTRTAVRLEADSAGTPVRYSIEARRGTEQILRLGGQRVRGRFATLARSVTGEAAREYLLRPGAVVVEEDGIVQYALLVRGRMLAEGRVYITDAWWLVTLPGLAIMLTILSINLLGDGLRDALDPRLRNL